MRLFLYLSRRSLLCRSEAIGTQIIMTATGYLVFNSIQFCKSLERAHNSQSLVLARIRCLLNAFKSFISVSGWGLQGISWIERGRLFMGCSPPDPFVAIGVRDCQHGVKYDHVVDIFSRRAIQLGTRHAR